ncbi:hypothetical protein AN403_5252 [Pseudomonas fluorescens]|uniref:Uncharacterized protein n=1 Tax=Pseudomonas fluorescens TaxID=294 RepID=A0A0P8Z6Q0_PSEFL|nr:hypothetical protein AN403_5252 [Pseudomonas fluorescens]
MRVAVLETLNQTIEHFFSRRCPGNPTDHEIGDGQPHFNFTLVEWDPLYIVIKLDARTTPQRFFCHISLPVRRI